MSNYKNPFSKGGKFYNPRITDASRVTDASKVTEPRIRPRWLEEELKDSNDNDARYIITIYSPYISHKIKWALKYCQPYQRSERIKELLAHIFSTAEFTSKQKELVKKGLRQGNYYNIQLPYDLATAKIATNIGENKAGIVFYLVVGTPYPPNTETPNKINSPYTIERKEYATLSRAFVDHKINIIENIGSEISEEDLAITTLLLIPFSFAILGAKMRKKVVMSGITLEGKLGFGAGIAGKLSFGLAAAPIE